MLSGFFTDKDVVAEDFAAFAAGILSNGVLADKEDTLKITAGGGMTVTANKGYCWINGFFGKAEATEYLALSTASGTYPRYDRVVARLDLLQKEIYLTVIEGTPSETPLIPSIVRDGTYYDLGLALIFIPAGALEVAEENIEDTRMDEAVCGGVIARTAEKLALEGKADKSEIVSFVTVGDIKANASVNPPSRWMICDGRAISREIYSELFLSIGTTYGAGDGETTFNIPDLRGRVIAGYNADNGGFNAIGKKGGSSAHNLTIDEMPSHTHNMKVVSAASGDYEEYSGGLDSSATYDNAGVLKTISGITSTGGGASFSLLQPYITLNYLIYTGVV